MTKNTQPKNKSELATTETNNPVVSGAMEYDYSQYADQGFENHTSEDYAVPFLAILQSQSKLIETNAQARPGMLVNTVTQQLYAGDKGVNFIPVATLHNVIEWKPRNLGGGFIAAHAMDSELVKKVKDEQEFGKYKVVKGDANSNDLIETQSVYGIFLDDEGNSGQMIISFSSSKIKKYKGWMTKARTVQVPLPNGMRINPPLFAHKYRITTVKETNSNGTFYNFSIDFDGKSAEECRLPTNHPLFQDAVAFSEFIKKGQVKAAYESQERSSATEEVEQEIPFA